MINGYHMLANSIIKQAVDDYIDCLIDWNEAATVNEAECESFFRSDWFQVLTDVDGEGIIHTCKMMVAKMKNLQFDIKHLSKTAWGVLRIDSADVIKVFGTKSSATEYAAALQGIPVRYFVKGMKLKALKAGDSYSRRKTV